MPATIKWIEMLDSSLNDNEIILRDTDHTYDSLRFEYTNYGSSNYQELDGLISKYISTHCCICGSTNEIQIDKYDARSSDAMLNTFCGRCFSIRNGLYSRIKYNLTHNITTDINPKTRIKFEDGQISYVRLNDLTIDKESNIRTKKFGEKVYIVGVDLGLRDINDERVYDGDIVICRMADGRRYGGMIVDYSSINPQWPGERFMVCHGYGNFPSHFSLAKEFKVIGNIGENANFLNLGPNERDFEIWLTNNQNKFDSYFN